MNADMTKEDFWNNSWEQHIEQYLAAPPRAGYWVERTLGLRGSILELAGGSCRDSRYLAERGMDSTGSDFDERTINILRKRFPDSPHQLRREDAFSLSFGDKTFDTTFSNGFWIYFSDNEDIKRLCVEQARVTKRWLIVLAHNALNSRLVRTFDELKGTDDLYDIRFFKPQELVDAIGASGVPHKSIRIRKFGGPLDVLYSKKLKGVPNPFHNAAPHFVPSAYSLQPWSLVERVACIVELA